MSTPRLDYGLFGQIRVQDFIPTNHDLAVFAHDRLQPPIEVRLQGVIILNPLLLHELPDLVVLVPFLAIHLVPADVEILVREQLRHLSDKLLKETSNLISTSIHCTS